MNRFPRTQAVLDALAAATVLRQAAADLESLTGEATELEPGTLRRRVRAIGIEVAFQLESEAP